MTRVLLAIPEPRAAELAAELELEDVEVIAVVPEGAVLPLPAGVDVVVIAANRAVLVPALVEACDRAGVRIVPFGD
ncbi:MAG TPA: hypothetical protein VFF85_10385, partial [Microbacterium sp.]|nr:hypothetical protein [Microbacterium sp.]